GDGDPRTLYVYFLGKLPRELAVNRPGIERFLAIDGGERITGIRITDVDPQVQADPERDDYLVVRLDRAGDFAPYTLRLVGVEGIDPRYDRASFSFKIDCPGDIDCKPACDCPPAALEEPQISYLAKDYASFRQLILDRLAVLVPGWTERHVPDLGITLVELLAYVGDHLSYYQDAVATEAYIGTARQRISVRRHARLVDYRLHEGCNARAWVQLEVSGHLELPSDRVAFITGLNVPQSLRQPVMALDALARLPAGSFEYFEPLPSRPARTLALRPAHNRIGVYTWGRRECCLMPGTTRVTLLDQWMTSAPKDGAPSQPTRALAIEEGDVLVFEEVMGAKTGVPADADPSRRWAVRVTRVQAAEDPLYPVELHDGETTHRLPTPLVEIEWSADDALPFALCLSTLGPPPECAYLADVTVVRGNVVPVDHGRSQPPEPLPPVPGEPDASCCECEGQPRDVPTRAGRYRPTLAQAPLVFAEPLPQPPRPASQSLAQDPRAAVPALLVQDDEGQDWHAQPDLLASGPDDRDLVAEIDNEGRAHLRFGDGELGRSPRVGEGFSAGYRVGGGAVGNVGAEAISVLVLDRFSVDGVTVAVRNPLPAQGGIDPEPIEEARLLAPAAFRRQIERAITAADYAELAQRHRALQRAAARLAWTGSWYEADVAVDPLGAETADDALLHAIAGRLYRYRRMGHDLRVQRAVYVPLKLALEVCALPGHERGHVRSALLARFGRGLLPGGQRGFFHPDELSFGESVFLSRIVAAAQGVAGVECVTVTELHRLFEPPNHEIDNGVLPLASNEIAQLDNDPNHPERGQLQITVRGGR
ncbi:MAG TPA: putative baseplate assembly protein, partial [Albitalea sp.]|nr:putative baseplate assembly protein [Albitalea sp.]